MEQVPSRLPIRHRSKSLAAKVYLTHGILHRAQLAHRAVKLGDTRRKQSGATFLRLSNVDRFDTAANEDGLL